MAHEVFLCYANRDKKFADEICSALESSGITCWMAPRDVMAGEDWDKAITSALSRSLVLVLIFSANSNDSDYCINEVNIAFDNKQEIVPVFVDNTLPSGGMQLYLKRKQWLYANTLPLEPHLKKLVEEVKRQLSRIKAREESAAKEKARREAEAKAREEAEEAKRAEEIARAKREAEEAEAASERTKKEAEEAEIARTRKEAEETKKAKQAKEAKEAAARAKKDAEEAAKLRERQEEDIAKAREQAEVARKAREAAIKAKQEAEEAIKEKQRVEAEAAKARKDAEAARQAREAAIKAEKKAREEARKIELREPAKEKQALTAGKPGKSRTVIYSIVIGIVVIAGGTIGLNSLFSSGDGTPPPETPVPLAAGSGNETTTPPPTTPPATIKPTPSPTPAGPSSPDEYLVFDFSPTSFEKTEITGGEIFLASVSGNVTCLRDLPLDVQAIRVSANILASKSTGGASIVLSSVDNITLEDVPAVAGETTDFKQEVPLKFPDTTETGTYNITVKIKNPKINIGWWVTVTEYFNLEEEMPLGTVEYSNVSTYDYLEGYIRDAVTKEPLRNAKIELINPEKNDSVVAIATSDASGLYKTTRFSTSGPYTLRVTITGFETQWYKDTSDKTKATPLTFKTDGETKIINFDLTRLGSISGKVISDVDGKGIADLHVYIVEYTSNKWIAATETNSDGTYTISGVSTGSYRVRAFPSQYNQPYADEFYNNTYDVWNAQAVAVATSQAVTGINFSLAPGGMISGTVRNADGSAPLANVFVECTHYVNGVNVGGFGVNTDSVGKYTLAGLPYGDYVVRARATSATTNYIMEYYPEKTMLAQAKLLKISGTSNPSGIDLTLEPGGSISGKVISDATKEPVAYLHVDIFNYDTGEWLGCADTDFTGAYTLHGLRAGRYRVQTSAFLNGLPYYDEYYNNTTNSNSATPVTVSEGQNTPNIDFSLRSKTS